jgi:tetratricopeptide (TPR) repeat protein
MSGAFRHWPCAVIAAAGLALGASGCRAEKAEADAAAAAAPGAAAAPAAPQAPAAEAQRDVARSIAYLNSQRVQHPHDPDLLVALGKAYVAAGRLQDGLAAFQDAARLDSKHVPAFLGQGQVWLRLSRPAKAVEAYLRAERLHPDHPLIELELASAYMDLRDFVSAQKHAERAQKLDSKNPEVFRALGLIYAATGDITATTRAGQQAIDLAPNDLRNWNHMGVLYGALRQHAEAARCFRRALELDPAHVDANVQLAETLNQLDQEPGTRKEMEHLLGRALTLNPHYPRALYLLGKLYLEDGKVDLAVPTLRRAVRWHPQSQEAQLALGQALTRQGNTEEGRKLLARAQQALDGTIDFRGLEFQAYTNPNPDVHIRLAELYERNDMYDSALYAVGRGLKLSPKDERLLALRARLLRNPPALAAP